MAWDNEFLVRQNQVLMDDADTEEGLQASKEVVSRIKLAKTVQGNLLVLKYF